MSDFKVIETQEQLDAIIGERVSRAEKKGEERAAARYADYEDLKAKADTYEKQIADLNEQLKGNETKQAEFTRQIEDLTKKAHQYEIGSVKTKVALEVGLPYQLADKLSGDDEDAIREDAKKMAEFITMKQVAPIGSLEPNGSNENPKDAAFLDMARQIGKEY